MRSTLPIQSHRTASAAVESILEHTALLGSFSPLLVVQDVRPAQRAAVLNYLGDKCLEVSKGDAGILWRMNADARREILARMAGEGRLVDAARSIKKRKDDVFGNFLRDALGGKSFAMHRLSRLKLDHLHTALQFATPYIRNNMKGTVEKFLGRQDAEDTISFVKPRSLVGRENELATLTSFVAGEVSDKDRFVLLSGIGGSGKSALLAELVAGARGSKWQGTTVVWFDFDRALFASAEPLTLIMEFTRQLALHRPDLAAALSKFRRQCRERWATRRDIDNYDARAAYESEVWSLWVDQMNGHLPLKQPLLLVLDTFEEVLFRERSEIRALLRWVESLRIEGQVPELRTILSGRVSPGVVLDDLPFYRNVILGDLEPDDAVQLLSNALAEEGVEPSEFPVGILADRIGGNPLLLKLAARFCASQGAEAASALAMDVEGIALRGAVAETFIYTRILGRLRTTDPDVKKLAHPGLALRRVTPALIQHVLAEPCGIGPIDEGRALALFEELTRQVWLVEGVGNQEVRHRTELRRHMLPLLAAIDPIAFSDVHSRAADYYSRRADDRVPPTQQDVEAAYHRLFDPTLEVSESDALFLASVAGSDIEALPGRVRAQLKAASGHRLTSDESVTLPDDRRSQVASRSLRNRLVHGEGVGWDKTVESPSVVRGLDPSVQILVQFGAGNASAVLEAFYSDPTSIMDDAIIGADASAPFFETNLWRVALASLAVPEEMVGVMAAIRDDAADHRSPKQSDRRASALVAHATALLEGRPTSMVIPLSRGKLHFRFMEDLRSAQLHASANALDQEFSIPSRIVPYLSREMTDWLSDARPDAAPEILEILQTSIQQKSSLASIRVPLSLDTSIDMEAVPRFLRARILRGLTPELYEPARRVLQMAHSRDVLHFVEQLAREFSWWPKELMTRPLQEAIDRDPARWIATLVETTDLAGRLGELVSYATGLGTTESFNRLDAIWKAYDSRLKRWLE